MQMLMLMIQLMIGRQADGQMSIRKDSTEGDFDAAAYAAKYTDADADDAADCDDTSDADDTADKKKILILILLLMLNISNYSTLVHLKTNMEG